MPMPLSNIHDRVVWWSPPKQKTRIPLFSRPKKENIGDTLAPAIVERMLHREGLSISDRAEKSFRLFSVGSILHFAESGDTIWGTGVNGKIPPSSHTYQFLDVRAVRGPITRTFLEKRDIPCPKVYGDPGILLPEIFPELIVDDPLQGGILIVPHLHDSVPSSSYDVLLPSTHWLNFIKRIQNTKFVISSSLHGMIVAEAFGIPARWYRSTTEDDSKYQDYFLATGRNNQIAAGSIEKAIQLGPHDPPKLDTKSIMNSFPYDLWTQ